MERASAHWSAGRLAVAAAVVVLTVGCATTGPRDGELGKEREASSMFMAGKGALEEHRYEDSRAFFTGCLELLPARGECHLGLASSLVGLNRLDEAVAHFREVLRLMPDDPRAPQARKFIEDHDAALAARRGGPEGGPVRLDARAIQKAVIEQAGEATVKCFDSHRAELPASEGVVQVRFTILQSGEVTGAQAPGDAGGTSVGACLEQVMLRVRFPPQVDRAITATAPFAYQLRPVTWARLISSRLQSS